MSNPPEQVQIGKTKDGQPIWFEPKDLIPTPDEDLERWEKTLDSRTQAMLDMTALLILKNAAIFIEATVMATADRTLQSEMINAPDNEIVDCMSKAGYTVIQDGLTTVIKHKGKILREMTAQMPTTPYVANKWKRAVENKVNRIVNGKAKKLAQMN